MSNRTKILDRTKILIGSWIAVTIALSVIVDVLNWSVWVLAVPVIILEFIIGWSMFHDSSK
jgi:hypothetical protein